MLPCFSQRVSLRSPVLRRAGPWQEASRKSWIPSPHLDPPSGPLLRAVWFATVCAHVRACVRVRARTTVFMFVVFTLHAFIKPSRQARRMLDQAGNLKV